MIKREEVVWVDYTDPSLPKKVKDALKELAYLWEWNNDSIYEWITVDDLSEYDEEKEIRIIWDYLINQGVKKTDTILIRFWW